MANYRGGRNVEMMILHLRRLTDLESQVNFKNSKKVKKYLLLNAMSGRKLPMYKNLYSTEPVLVDALHKRMHFWEHKILRGEKHMNVLIAQNMYFGHEKDIIAHKNTSAVKGLLIDS